MTRGRVGEGCSGGTAPQRVLQRAPPVPRQRATTYPAPSRLPGERSLPLPKSLAVTNPPNDSGSNTKGWSKPSPQAADLSAITVTGELGGAFVLSRAEDRRIMSEQLYYEITKGQQSQDFLEKRGIRLAHGSQNRVRHGTPSIPGHHKSVPLTATFARLLANPSSLCCSKVLHRSEFTP